MTYEQHTVVDDKIRELYIMINNKLGVLLNPSTYNNNRGKMLIRVSLAPYRIIHPVRIIRP